MRSSIIPVVGLAIVALLIAVLPGGVWTALLLVNLRADPTIPWSAAAMAFLLWGLWRYLAGGGPPRSTSEARHRLLRARRISPAGFTWACAAGIFGVIALAGFWIVLVQLVKFVPRALPDFSKYPLFTVATVIAIACLVSSLPEEAAFRGYFQGSLERKFSGPTAIIVTALVMAPAHCLTQGFVWPVIVFYLLVDSMLGAIAYLTNSIVPGIAVHFVGLLLFFTAIWPHDTSRRAFSDGGTDLWFWIHLAQFIVFGLVAVVAFWRLSLVQRTRATA